MKIRMLLPFLHCITEGRNLNAEQAREAMLAILRGQASNAQIAAFLVALRMKGETSDELLGFARAMRETSQRVEAGEPLLDTCGTGGADGPATFNISTVSAFVVAGAGVRVAKHGTRSISSQCGSADVLEAMGINPSLSPEGTAESIRRYGIGFLFAPLMHPAMKHAHPVRLELKMRTVFNLLGPLTNPARASRQLIGAPSQRAAGLMARALAGLGPERAFVVHGSDGLDEVTTTGETTVYEVCGGNVHQETWTPEQFGVERAKLADLRGGDKEVNSAIAQAILHGGDGPQRDIVLVNSAAALVAAGAVESVQEGVRLAAQSIDSGAAWAKVEALRLFVLQ
ncbi:MAG TPA: anthranilate phosphoribosyltransferase [Bryobacteraceae bacterium]|nr:anthranilate phosphoribosyltransferase [Bryobacteraceae bacterium]